VAEIVDEVRRFIKSTWNPTLTLRQWWQALAEARLSFPSWPEGHGGRGLSAAEARAARSAIDAEGVIGAPGGIGANLAAPTLLKHGDEHLLERFLPGIAHGTEGWCQLFSEPGAGSDLAGLRTRATPDGEEWLVDGQKVWNSNAHAADFGLLLARTNADVPKHKGLSYFVLAMEQHGVETRPLRQMNGDAEFDEVFLTGARVPADQLVGSLGDGWMIANTTLAFERGNIASRGAGISLTGGTKQGHLDVTVGELLERRRGQTRQPISGYVIGNRQMIELAREFGRSQDPSTARRLSHGHRRQSLDRAAGRSSRQARHSRTGELGGQARDCQSGAPIPRSRSRAARPLRHAERRRRAPRRCGAARGIVEPRRQPRRRYRRDPEERGGRAGTRLAQGASRRSRRAVPRRARWAWTPLKRPRG
jgi:Acyl-CoA dehydrogenase, middle domain/Acyl-CoA dehydrogenase, N-terminal domain